MTLNLDLDLSKVHSEIRHKCRHLCQISCKLDLCFFGEITTNVTIDNGNAMDTLVMSSARSFPLLALLQEQTKITRCLAIQLSTCSSLTHARVFLCNVLKKYKLFNRYNELVDENILSCFHIICTIFHCRS